MLYEAQLRGIDVADVIAAEVVPSDPFARRLAIGVWTRVDEFDARIGALLRDGWTLDRLAVLDRWVLRLGLHELDAGEAPPAVVMSEAVELAAAYGATDESPRFVNGLLAAAARR